MLGRTRGVVNARIRGPGVLRHQSSSEWAKNLPLRSCPTTPETVVDLFMSVANVNPVDGWVADQMMVALLSMNLPVKLFVSSRMRVSFAPGLAVQRTSNLTNDGMGGIGGMVKPVELKMSR